jgi:signal transduction histidine kinase
MIRHYNYIKQIRILLFLLLTAISGLAQEKVVNLSPDMFMGNQEIQLASLEGWVFKKGNDKAWSDEDLPTNDWENLSPMQLSPDMADKNGKVEGWFRLKVNIDPSFKNMPLGIRFYSWAATDLYIDGKFIKSSGNTGSNGKPYEEFNPNERLPYLVNLKPGEHVIAFHFVDETTNFPAFPLKSFESGTDQFIKLTGPKYYKTFSEYLTQVDTVNTTIVCISGVLAFLFLLLAFQNRSEKYLWSIVIFTLFTFLDGLFTYLAVGSTVSFFNRVLFLGLSNTFYWLRFLMIPVILVIVFKRNFSWDLKYYLALNVILIILLNSQLNHFAEVWFISGILLGVCYLVSERQQFKNKRFKEKLIFIFKGFRVLLGVMLIIEISSILQLSYFYITIGLLISVCTYYFMTSLKYAKGAQWAIIVGLVLTLIWFLVMQIAGSYYKSTIFPYNRVYNILSYISLPLSLLVFMSIRFKEILTEVQTNATRVVQLSEEKKKQAINQQKILQEEVNHQTEEIRNSLENLKATQSQLIQSEKMASLGELTAGIAHEIQNPLNFVNNFSEVSNELIDEMNEELDKGDIEVAKAISVDIKQNLEKINHHGKRADSIVKGMLQHSRSSNGKKEPTDINALADEYLRLAYHGLRAKDKSFNATMTTHFDDSIGKVKIIPQDIGRVILNLITNAFYVVDEKKKSGIKNYEPIVTVSTKKRDEHIEIRVTDNGNGIPETILNRIFEPFFTTKPTGKGTGLGLSMSYDIITKGHNGDLKVETKEGVGTSFIITLPN